MTKPTFKPPSDSLTIAQLIEHSGLSRITILRALSISRGNRKSFGRSRMPGLHGTRIGWGEKLYFKRSDVVKWLAARAKLNGAGFLKKKKAAASRGSTKIKKATKPVMPIGDGNDETA
jgi:hypothetical protein